MDLSECHTRLQGLLGDTGTRYSSALLDEAVRWALNAYSAAHPQIKTGVITAAGPGREQSLAALPDLLTVLEVVFPYQSDAPVLPVQRQWYFYTRDGGNWLYLGGMLTPAAGDQMQVAYAARHTLQGLDAAVLTSVPAEHELLFLRGAAGQAASLRSLHMVEAYGRKTTEPDKLQVWAGAALDEFRRELNVLKTSQSLKNTLTGGWTLDRWDS